MAPPINPNSNMRRVVAVCQEPRTVEQIADALSTDVVVVRQTIQNLISRRRLCNVGNRRGGLGVRGLYVDASTISSDPFAALESAWRQAA